MKFLISGKRKKEEIPTFISLCLLPLMPGLPSDSTFEPESGPCVLKQGISTDDKDLCAAVIVM